MDSNNPPDVGTPASRPASPDGEPGSTGRRTTFGPGMLVGPPFGCRDLGIGALLAVLYLVLVMSTTSMGFTRDETFYFDHARTYLNWMLRIVRADGTEERGKLLSRKEVKKVWKNNFEHPPLMKVLFGVSWRFLGQKMRPAAPDAEGRVRIADLGLAHGFEPGDEVPFLLPSQVGEDPRSAERRGGLVRILERRTHDASGEIVDSDVPPEELTRICREATENAEATWQTPCQVRSAGPLQFLSETDAYRLPGALMGALLVLLLYLLAVELGSARVGLLAVLFFMFIPRAFFHAHLTCFDIPITALDLACLLAFLRSLRSGRWAVATGVLWGLALLTKLNAFFIPVTLFLWYLAVAVRDVRREGPWRWTLPDFPLAFILMPLIGLPMLFALWPWVWYDTMAAFAKYVGFHLHHEHYFVYYFGKAYQSPPFPIDYPFTMTFITLPVVLLLLSLAGLSLLFLPAAAPTSEGSRRRWFLLINMLFPIVLIALPSTPIFGGVKHWMLAFPFLCILAAHALLRCFEWAERGVAAVGVRWVDRGLAMRPVRLVVGAGLVLLLAAPAARDTLAFVSNGTAYFNELMRGPRGAAEARVQRQFWSYASRGAVDYLNRTVPPGTTVDFQDATVSTCSMYRREGWLRHDLACAARRHAPDVLLFDVDERFSEEEIRYWGQMDTLGPTHEVHVQGVPVLRVYRKGAGLRFMQESNAGGGGNAM
ncbi:MAG: phospholipid carrier-dependent glycosyltransferase [Deltaproteobacteria bacterium]|nr:phospholipid carrier-dependent glycosyltransferase [Deltaproteobacteria bacterium]